ncbi:iron ABC transporter permease [Sesbania bispinosa]|nr:iron ABC transporter permease [Sesbania bispinosa]
MRVRRVRKEREIRERDIRRHLTTSHQGQRCILSNLLGVVLAASPLPTCAIVEERRRGKEGNGE